MTPKEARNRLSISEIMAKIGVQVNDIRTDEKLFEDCWWVSGTGSVGGEMVTWGCKIYDDMRLVSPRYYRGRDFRDGHYWWNIWESKDGGKTFEPRYDNKVDTKNAW